MEDITHLLKPRYKVLADYPGNKRKVGTIIDNPVLKSTYEQYPHLFHKMDWWDERIEAEFPDYVRSGKTVLHIDNINHQYIFHHTIFFGVKCLPGGEVIDPEYLRPATKYEYETYRELLKSE